MPSNRNRIVATVAAAALAGGGAGAGAVALSHGSTHTTTTVEVAAPGNGRSNVANSALSVGQIAKATTPGIVEIDATSAGTTSPFPYGGSASTQSAEGTGIVYDAKGDIVTNDHVIAGAGSVSVKFGDGSTYKATVVGADPSTDIAVIHVDAPASKLVPLTLGDSSTVGVGDGVVAIGNPFGLDDTVTSGIVSAINREIIAPDNSPIEGAIQTDAAINHGNSGGALLNLQGQVIGITSQIQSDSGGNEGVGFAIPSNTVRTIAGELISSGKAEHALLGVEVKTASNGNGVSVASVQTGSAAAAAGLKAGDVIVGVGGANVRSAQQLRAIIDSHRPGDKLSLQVLRGGSTKTFSATLGARS
ncbi:MAG TPA: trypsin-like peptidase domain-containing protein [Gaiellaceae bacterium]|nr:trypsin-like peptidase domain-containing protein [Gaiellaceae bacterium]